MSDIHSPLPSNNFNLPDGSLVTWEVPAFSTAPHRRILPEPVSTLPGRPNEDAEANPMTSNQEDLNLHLIGPASIVKSPGYNPTFPQ